MSREQQQTTSSTLKVRPRPFSFVALNERKRQYVYLQYFIVPPENRLSCPPARHHLLASPSGGPVSPCLRMGHSLNLHARFTLQLLRVPPNRSRSGQINNPHPPHFNPAEILHIIGTILRRTNQNQSQKKRGCFHLMSSGVNLRSSGHLRIIFLSEAPGMAADRVFEFVSLSLGGERIFIQENGNH